ncbi:MAG TPA: DUF4037 domain-containing protein [Polyangiaceae bacterium]|nr:DUF4037 domain-containing protein [Polyangiaceae bacterium]
MSDPNLAIERLTRTVTEQLAALPEVVAIALGGSRAVGRADPESDIDLYIYTRADVPLLARHSMVQACGGASRADIGMTFWGPDDEWIDLESGIEVDLIYFGALWMEQQIDQVLAQHRASLGYTTCLWHTMRNHKSLHDPTAWLSTLQSRCQEGYPEPLRRNIVAMNHPVLTNVIPSYATQLQKAVERRDLVSINHRLAGFLASYFDILFALNRVPHPGEKRLVQCAQELCTQLPSNMAEDISLLLEHCPTKPQAMLADVARVAHRLDELLAAEGFDPGTSHTR